MSGIVSGLVPRPTGHSDGMEEIMDYGRTFFTSDTHFGHANILKYCNRPFDSVEQMDSALVDAWNDRVGKDDVVYHLGDFTLRGDDFAQEIFGRLQGRIRMLHYPWHHDRRWAPPLAGPSRFRSASGHPVEMLPPIVSLDLPTDGPFPKGLMLCHFPMAVWDRKHHGAWHLHGHSHGMHRGEGAMLDVGVDVHDYQPLSLAEIIIHFGGL